LDAEEIMGFPLAWIDEKAAPSKANSPQEIIQKGFSPKAFSCPKCGTHYAGGDTECTKCGLVFLQFKEAPRPTADQARASVEVRELWEAVIADYQNFERHQHFVNAAAVDRSLPYAAGQYARILEVCPQDESAQKAQKEISSIAFARFDANAVRTREPQSIFAAISFRKIKLTSYILVLCGAVITMGFILPHQRNLVGVGTSIMFFILALRYYFRVI